MLSHPRKLDDASSNSVSEWPAEKANELLRDAVGAVPAFFSVQPTGVLLLGLCLRYPVVFRACSVEHVLQDQEALVSAPGCCLCDAGRGRHGLLKGCAFALSSCFLSAFLELSAVFLLFCLFGLHIEDICLVCFHFAAV